MTKLYLISPPQITLTNFTSLLDNVLASGAVSAFQLRLKDTDSEQIEIAACELLTICQNHKIQFILNDNPELAQKIGADGVHLGESDCDIKSARKILGQDKIIGASCYNSRHRAMEAGEDGADYLAFGALFPTTTKKVKAMVDPETIKWAATHMILPIVAIGGINEKNAHLAAATKADLVAVISGVWHHRDGAVAGATAIAERIKNV